MLKFDSILIAFVLFRPKSELQRQLISKAYDGHRTDDIA